MYVNKVIGTSATQCRMANGIILLHRRLFQLFSQIFPHRTRACRHGRRWTQAVKDRLIGRDDFHDTGRNRG